MPSGLLLMFTTSQKYNQAMRRVGWPARCGLCLFLLSLPFINLKHPSSNSATGFYKAGLHANSQKAILRGLEPCSLVFQGLWCPWQNFPLCSVPSIFLRGLPLACSMATDSSCLLHSCCDGKQSKYNLFCIYVQTIGTVLCIYDVLITAVCLSLGFMLIQHIYPLVFFW